MSILDEAFEAVRSNDVAALIRLIDAHETLLSTDLRPKESALLAAVYSRSKDIVRYLVERGVVPNVWEAAGGGLVNELRKILASRPEVVSQMSWDGWTPLHLAALFGQVETATVLLDAGADMLAPSFNRNGGLSIDAAVVGIAAGHGDLEVIRLLIARGCPVDAQASEGDHTPLFSAAFFGNIEVVKFLLSVGANPAMVIGGWTALDRAKEGGHQAVMDVLMSPCKR